jgi:hypothetical protein
MTPEEQKQELQAQAGQQQLDETNQQASIATGTQPAATAHWVPVQTATGIQETTPTPNPTPTPAVTTPAFNPYAVTYQEALSNDPNLKKTDWINGTTQWRMENGKDPLTYAEIGEVLKGQDPRITEEQREKAEKALRGMERINAVGSFLGNLLNYARTNKGHMAMNLSGMGQEGQQRVDRLRAYNEKLDRQGYDDYVTAITRDRAEAAARQAREQAQRNQEAQQQRASQQWAAEFGLKVDQANAAQAQRQQNQANIDRAFNETSRHNRAMENKPTGSGDGSGGSRVRESFTTTGGSTYTRDTPLSAQEARNIIQRWGTDAQRKAINQEQTAFGSKVDVIAIASDILTSGDIPEKHIRNIGFKKTVSGTDKFTISDDGEVIEGGKSSKPASKKEFSLK